jgi:hypothetical protein
MSNCAIKLKNHVSKEVKIVAPQIASNFVSTANVGLGSDYIEVKFESREVGDSQQYPLQAANELAKQIKSTYPELSKNIDIRNSTIKNAKILKVIFPDKIAEKIVDRLDKTQQEQDEIIAEESKPKVKTEIKPGVQELFDSNPELANQVYEALGLEKTFNGYNVNNLLNEVINKSKNKDLVYVAKLLNSKDFISKLNILEKKLDRLGKNQVSFIEKNIISNVYIDSNKIKDSSTSFEEVVLHELIHRYTSFIGISKQLQIPISEKENEFYKDMSAAYTIYTEKGFKDLGLDEFIAQSLTNKEVINNLKSIKINNTNLLERIINFVKKLIDKQTNTLFDFTSASVTNYINNLEDKVIENYYSESELTPQQKQQALQLYSQYLDTGKQDIEGFKEFAQTKSAATLIKPGVEEQILSPEMEQIIKNNHPQLQDGMTQLELNFMNRMPNKEC